MEAAADVVNEKTSKYLLTTNTQDPGNELSSKNCVDLRTFVIKMSRVEFTRFFNTKT